METPNYNRKATLTTTDHFATDSSVDESRCGCCSTIN